MYPNGLTNLTEIWNQDFLGDDTSFEEKAPFWEIEPCPFKVGEIKQACINVIWLHYHSEWN